MENQKTKFPFNKLAAAVAIGCFLLVLGSIITWIWVGEVRASCSDSYEYGWGGTRNVDHWHCTEGSESDVAFWNAAYGFMWKMSITLVIIGVLATLAWRLQTL